MVQKNMKIQFMYTGNSRTDFIHIMLWYTFNTQNKSWALIFFSEKIDILLNRNDNDGPN